MSEFPESLKRRLARPAAIFGEGVSGRSVAEYCCATRSGAGPLLAEVPPMSDRPSTTSVGFVLVVASVNVLV